MTDNPFSAAPKPKPKPKPRRRKRAASSYKKKYEEARDVLLQVQFTIKSLRRQKYFRRRWGKYQDMLDAIERVI
jgi:hypothetical protein